MSKTKLSELPSGQAIKATTGSITVTAGQINVDNIKLDANTISATTGALNLTPATGSAIVLDGAINIDAGVITGATSTTSTVFIGDLTGKADTADALETARTIGGTSFDGTANIVPSIITAANESTDTTCFPAFFTAATGDLQPKTNTNLTFNSNTGALGANAVSVPASAGITIGTDSIGTYADVTLSSTQILALDATPITLVAAPGAGKFTIPLMVAMRYNFNTTAYAGIAAADNFNISHNGGGPIIAFETLGMIDQTNDERRVGVLANSLGVSNNEMIVNAALEVSLGGPVTTGDGTIDIRTYYITLDDSSW